MSRSPAPTTSDLQRRDTDGSHLRRRSTRHSAAGHFGTNAAQSDFTLAGPDDGAQLRAAHENFVQLGYADLNPAYEQLASAKPVWSLAKPLPRVVRPSMVPTKSEIMEKRQHAELPGEHSASVGLDVDPNDLEQGKVQMTLDPRKLTAQLIDSRAQRENNFLHTIHRVRTMSQIGGSPRLSHMASQASLAAKRRRASTSATNPGVMTPTWETAVEDEQRDDVSEVFSPFADPPNLNDEHLRPPPHRFTGLKPIHEAQEPTQRADADAEDGASMSGMKIEDDPDYYEDLAPLLQTYVVDEIHNNHTSWSVIRTQHRELLAELLAVMVQLTLGFCADLSVTVAKAGNPNTTDWAWGLATMIGIYISGGISGAHLNPTVTIMLWFFRGFPKRKMPEYFFAQFLGAFTACFIAYGLYYASIQEYLTTESPAGIINSFVTSQRYSHINATTAFFNELIGTAVLFATVLALGDDQNAPPGAGMNAMM